MADAEEISYEQRAAHVTVISKPLAGKKLTKKVYKLVKKAAKAKQIKRGVKEVVKSQINEINERCKMKGCGAMIHHPK